MRIVDKFKLSNAKSRAMSAHVEGDVAFVSNGFNNNGVVGFITPLEGEKVFSKKSICVSAFCEATVQNPSFLPRGNGGSGLIVLTPREDMNDEEFYFYAAQINQQRWRFSFGRMVTSGRISSLKISDNKGFSSPVNIDKLLPQKPKKRAVKINRIKEFPITNLCSIDRKYSPYLNKLDTSIQRIPYVTTTEVNNGIALWCNEKPLFNKGEVTVSLDGLCGTSFYQFDDFISGEKTAVVKLIKENDPYLLFYIAALIRYKSWRFHYGRKLSMGRLLNFSIPIPINGRGEIDEAAIRDLVRNCYGSEIFEKHAVS